MSLKVYILWRRNHHIFNFFAGSVHGRLFYSFEGVSASVYTMGHQYSTKIANEDGFCLPLIYTLA